MSKQTEQETKVWKNFDYTQSWAYKTIQAWKDKATEAGLALEYPFDFPNDPSGQLDRFRTLDGLANLNKGPIEKVVTHMFRQVARDGKEYIYYSGQIYVSDNRGQRHSSEWKEGVHMEPGIVINPNQKYNPDTGQPTEPENILSGQKQIYSIELPKEKAARKKFIDKIIESNNSSKENIHYYYQELGEHNFANKSDSSFSYDEFVNCSIEELKDLNARGAASKSPGYWRDRDGVLRDKNGNKI